jgi:hypothetical protein
VDELEPRVVPTLLGQQLFPADYPWNQNISNAPVAANSAAIIAHIGSSIGIHLDWGDDSPANGSNPLYGIPVNVVHGNTAAKVSVVIDDYPGESDLVPVPIPAGAVIEGDYQNGPNPNGPGYGATQRGDSHLIVWDEDNNIAYELFGAARPSDPVTMDGLPTGSRWHAAQESVWDMKADSFRSLGNTSADAAGLSILAGLARPEEGLPVAQHGQGAIDHALRFTLPSGDVNPQYIYPASHVVSTSAGSTKLPFGARLRLMNTSAVNAVIAALGPEAQIIARAMQQYGLLLADIGSAMYVTGSSDAVDANNNISLTWDMNDVLGLRALTAADFEVVDLMPAVTGLSAASGPAGKTITVTGRNFSGAAGHLAVLFGSTPAASVTLVDNSHLTVVVPAGSGMVHLRVQSGVNETDPNNPADNVNNPIFGYGTSAATAADQFSYNNQTISGTNSTAAFASPTVGSGDTDPLTLVIKDTTGSAVSGLTAGAFSFVLAGGTSAGTFGTVTETATPGTSTVPFTATAAGTADTLTVAVSGVALTATPTVQVTTGGITLTAPGLTATAGQRFSGVAASFTDPTAGLQASQFSATITWGDSTISAGNVGGGGGSFTVSGGHPYAKEGRYPLTVAITANDGTSATASGLAHVARPGPPPTALGTVANALTHSAEYYGDIVTAVYQKYLGRTPAASEVAGWVSLMQQGLSDERLEANFIGSAEYIANHGGPGAGWVTGMYQDLLGRTPQQAEVNAWVQALAAGISPTQVAYGFAASAEREGQRITADYQKYLGRSPTAAEVNAWVMAFVNGYSNENVIAGFVGSAEYFRTHYDNADDWLWSAYQDILGRPPDAAGLQAWLNLLRNS